MEVLSELVGYVGGRGREAEVAASDQLFKAPWREHRLGQRGKEGKEGGVFLRSREGRPHRREAAAAAAEIWTDEVREGKEEVGNKFGAGHSLHGRRGT